MSKKKSSAELEIIFIIVVIVIAAFVYKTNQNTNIDNVNNEVSVVNTPVSVDEDSDKIKDSIVEIDEGVKLPEEPFVKEENVDKTEDESKSNKTLLDYFTNRKDYVNTDLIGKKIDAIGLNEYARAKVKCPEDLDGPCINTFLILSKEEPNNLEQEIYFAIPGGAGYDYFGPVTDNLSSLIDQAKSIELK